MLDPEYLANVSDQLLALIDELELSIIEDIAKRLVKTGSITDTSRGQAQIVQEAGVKNLENEAVIYKRAGKQATIKCPLVAQEIKSIDCIEKLA